MCEESGSGGEGRNARAGGAVRARAAAAAANGAAFSLSGRRGAGHSCVVLARRGAPVGAKDEPARSDSSDASQLRSASAASAASSAARGAAEGPLRRDDDGRGDDTAPR
jgi:hypothetical protein